MPTTVLTGTTTFQIGTGPTLNTIDGNGVIWRVDQNGFTGGGEPGTTLNPVLKPRAIGTWSGDSNPTGRTMSLSGTITAPTPVLLNAAIDSLINAVTAKGFALTVTESGVPWTAFVRRSGETLTLKITNLIASYSIQVHADDPRKFGTVMTGSTNLPASTGGAVWPEVWPEVWPAITTSGSVSLTNPGNTAGPVVLRIDGPCTGPQITHSGVALTFAPNLVIGVGEWLTVSMDNRQVLANDQANRAQYITSRGWSGFDPGPNTWSFAAAVYNASSLLTVSATPARK